MSVPGAARADEALIPPPKPLEPTTYKNQFVTDPITDFGMMGAALGFSLLLDQLISTGELTPQQPNNSAKLLSIDRPFTTRTPSSSAAALSNVGLGLAAGYAVLAPILTGVQDGAEAGLVDGILFAESVSFTLATTDLAKIAVRRPRPLAYKLYNELNPKGTAKQDIQSVSGTDTALSFFSGHASTVATISATATYLAFARAPSGSVRPWVTLLAGTLLTTFVSYERVNAGKHFPTDVIAGAMAGAGIGVIVPHLHRAESLKQRPVWIGGSFGADQGSLSLNGLFLASQTATKQTNQTGSPSAGSCYEGTIMRVLVVDDSADLRDLVERALTREDHQVVTVADAASADEALGRGSFDLVILDLGLPDGWGATWCQRVRHEGLDALVLVLTAHAEVAQRLEVFDAGADDFLAKPFAIAELRARIRALGRRRGVASATVLRHQETEVDLAARRAKREGAEAPLTAREWSVLECLWVARGRLVPRATLLGQVWGDTSKASAASLEVLVGRIRKKLGPDWIRTVRGEGYALGL